MKVKITKSSSPHYWYADKVGEIFEVTEDQVFSGDHKVTNGPYKYSLISKEDCEEVTMAQAKEESKEFKVGDEVRVIKGCIGGLRIYQDKTGYIESVDNGKFHPYRIKGFYNTEGHIAVWSAKELEHAEPKEPMLTKEEALKAAIDGAKVTNETNTDECYVYFGKHGFMFHNGITGENWAASWALEGKRWKLWTPPTPPKPKFSIDQFVLYEESYYKIIDTEYKHGSHRYFISGGIYANTKDNCQIADESELTEVKQ